MSDHSSIEWTEATWNPIAGCSLVSPGCTNCYAMRRVAPRLSANPATPHYHGTVKPSKGGPVWTGKIGIASDAVLLKPLSWRRPRMIFVNSTSDLFHPGVPDHVIDRIFAVMALCPQHTFQVLTKRPERMRAYMLERWQPAPAYSVDLGGARLDVPAETAGEDRRDQIAREAEELLLDPAFKKRLADTDNDAHWTEDGELKATAFKWPLPNVWLGTSVEDQQRADERIPHLLATPAAVRFISAEPLLGPIDLKGWATPGWDGDIRRARRAASLDWVIVGGESGTGARPMHPDWARSLRDQCAAAGVPFFFKQWGSFRIGCFDDELFSIAWQDGEDEYYGEHQDIAYGEHWLDGKTIAFPSQKATAGRLLDGIEHNAMPGRLA